MFPHVDADLFYARLYFASRRARRTNTTWKGIDAVWSTTVPADAAASCAPKVQFGPITGILALALTLSLAGCGGGGGSSDSAPPTPSETSISVTDVQQVIAQAVAEAQARNAKATIAVVDRVGNVLGVFQMTRAKPMFTITSGTGAQGGLESFQLPSPLAAISMAITGAYLSSAGNAFTTRTAGQIIQDHFNPQESDQPSGPLFGVQFSQLSCSDITTNQAIPTDGTTGPKRAPLGLAAEPGGLPLYRNGVLIGGIGVMATGIYSLDLDVIDNDTSLNELIAVAGAHGFDAPTAIRADHITVDGRSLRYTDSEAMISNPANAPPFGSLSAVGSLVPVAGYFTPPKIVVGQAFGTPPSGIRADPNPAFDGMGAYVLVNAANANRYPPIAATDVPAALTQSEVTQILKSGLDVANRARAQIRQPAGSSAQVTITVVDTQGNVLGLIRTPDAPVFGIDVSLQKARTAALFSSFDAGMTLAGLPPAGSPPTMFLPPQAPIPIGSFVTAMHVFLADPSSLANGVAYSNRAIGNLARPYFPDGITGTAAGPLSVAAPNWSVFNVGLQLDLVFNKLLAAIGGDNSKGCTGTTTQPGTPRLANGIQIFPGSVPIYRASALVGAIGVSGDGVDQDDMVAFLGLANAGMVLGTGIANAPVALRVDNILPQGQGTRLRYVNCPPAPFNDSTQQNVCSGI